MTNYKVSFFKIERETDKDGNEIKKGESFLGSVIVDDHGTDRMSIVSKAYRHASDAAQTADKVKVEEIR